MQSQRYSVMTRGLTLGLAVMLYIGLGNTFAQTETTPPATDPSKTDEKNKADAGKSEAGKKPEDTSKTPETDPTKTPATDPTKTPETDATKTPASDPTKTPASDSTKTPSDTAPGSDPTKTPGSTETPENTTPSEGTKKPEGKDGKSTPLVMQLQPNASKNMFSSRKVRFDINGDGNEDSLSWIHPSLSFLAIDKNQNGRIDSAIELFGNAYQLANGEQAVNGFVALAELDANKDGQITKDDPAFQSLLLWTDSNSDAKSSISEMQTLTAAGVLSLSTHYVTEKESSTLPRIAWTGSGTILRQGKTLPLAIWDVVFSFQTLQGAN